MTTRTSPHITSAHRQAVAFLDSWLAYRARQVDFPGFSVSISQGDNIIFSRAYGLADIETDALLTPHHRFATGSQSKMFTATAILQLAAQGKLSLDDIASRYLPWLVEHPDERCKDITLRQLLCHSSGLAREGVDANYWQLHMPFPTSAELRRIVLNSQIVVEPNTQLKYSNVGFALLGQVVEAVSGQSYQAFITQNIIHPLGMNSTTADYLPRYEPQIARSYSQPFEHRRQRIDHAVTDAFAPVVGVYSTPDDMCRFAQAHFMNNTFLLDDVMKKEMQRSQWVVTTGYDEGYELGLGFEVRSLMGRRLVGHTGHVLGYKSATFFDPYTQLAVSVMANGYDTPTGQILNGVFETLFFFETHASEPPPSALARFNVRLCRLFSTVEIVATATRIVAIDPDIWEPFSWPEELRKVSRNTLRITTVGNVLNEGELIRYRFKKDVVASVNYIGIDMTPEANFKTDMRVREKTR